MTKTEEYEQMVKNLISGLTCCPVESIDCSMPMQAYGVDSLMSQEVVAWAEKKLKVNLDQSQVFGGLTIRQLVELAL